MNVMRIDQGISLGGTGCLETECASAQETELN